MLHEGGHYLTAIASGMKVDRFSVFGIGPAIVKLGTWRGTEFVIGAIPFGAYVLIRGMEADDAPPDTSSPNSFNFRDKPIWKRALVIAGGPIANYIIAIVTFLMVFTLFGVKGPPTSIVIKEFGEDSPALAAGAEVGDELVRLGGVEIDPALGGNDVAPAATAHRGKTIEMTVRRGDALEELQIAIPTDEDKPPLSILMAGEGIERTHVDLGTAVVGSFEQPYVLSVMQLRGFGQLFAGKVSADKVQGPVRIVEEFAKAAALGLPDFLEMMALISTLLGLFNLLPLPALDGGRLVFLGYETIARRRANPRFEEAVHSWGMLVLLVLIGLVTIGDIARFF